MAEHRGRSSWFSQPPLAALVLGEAQRTPELSGVVLAERALRRIDPLARIFAERRLRSWLREAERSTQFDDEGHLLRLAFLIGFAGAPNADFDDRAAVQQEYRERKATLGPLRRYRFLLPLTVALPLVTAAALLYLVTRRGFDPRETPWGRVLGPALTQYVVAVNQPNGRPERGALVQAATHLDPALGGKLDQLLGSAEKVVGAGAEVDVAFDRLSVLTADFDGALRQASQPFFVESEPLLRGDDVAPLLLSFYVERERWFEIAGKKERVVRLWRLDELAVDQGYLGYTRPRTAAALVLLDQIEEDLVLRILPALAEGQSSILTERQRHREQEPWEQELDRRGGALVRAFRKEAFPEPRPSLDRLGALLAERRRLVEKWTDDVPHFRLPKRLIPEADYAAALENKAPHAELRRWNDLHAELLSEPVYSAFLDFRDLYVRAVERHELQHRIDYQAEFRELPEALATLFRIENRLDVPRGSLPGRTWDELSAHLAEAAEAPVSPKLSLLLLARHRLGSNGPYTHAARIAFEQLGSELGVPLPERRTPELNANFVLTVIETPTPRLREAVRRVFERVIGGKPISPRLVSDQAHEAWRH